MSIPTYSGLEPLRIFQGSNFVNIGERTNVTGSAAFRKLIKENKTLKAGIKEAKSVTKTGGTEIFGAHIAAGEVGLSGHAITATFPKRTLGPENKEQGITAAPIMGTTSAISNDRLSCVTQGCDANVTDT